ncbi:MULTISPECIES: glycosyltransferase family 2 protein [Halomonadaceae]|uniref:glycosyltransferase family 2 protein n=1 Tax=Halomonadaceae TaxID=28256 RepID=UPI0015974F82|nr:MULTISPECIES: glycosyltransferase family 2 protein [Halomonas]QJQ94004.1 glycosyltransferase family 2 protein [Halomonas sp. PA5]
MDDKDSMASAEMKIAVVIPCYNSERYLAQTVGSLLEQTKKPDEIIIVDDGSTDNSLAIARSFEALSNGLVRVYMERSANAPKTRNIGASLSNSDALMFLDADDVLAPETLDGLSHALSQRGDAVAVCPWRRLILDNERWLSQPASCAHRKPGQDALSAWLNGWYYPPCAVLWPTQVFATLGGWDEEATLNQDGDLMMRALAHGIPLIEASKGTAYYRKSPAGETSLSGKKFTYEGLNGRFSVIEKITRILEEQKKIALYREPLSRGYAAIANDAEGRFAGINLIARAAKRKYELPLVHRIISLGKRRIVRLTGKRSGSIPSDDLPKPNGEEVLYGTDWLKKNHSRLPSVQTIENATLRRPSVSVIITVYNRAKLLSRAIDSVLNQTFEDYEVLIVDDCSQDDPRSIISSYNESRLRYLRQEINQGVAAARNRGLREAKAPLVAFLDDDDEWFPEKLSRQVDLFNRSSPEVGLIYTGVETVTGIDEPVLELPSARGNLYRELLVKNLLHGGSSAMIRRNVITRIGFFDETLPAIEDYDYWLRIGRYYNIESIRDPLVRYHDLRDLPEGDSARRSLNIKANLEARKQFYRKHGKQMREEGVAHLFLAQSARRHLSSSWHDVREARKLAAQAFMISPTSPTVLTVLAKSLISKNWWNRLKRA